MARRNKYNEMNKKIRKANSKVRLLGYEVVSLNKQYTSGNLSKEELNAKLEMISMKLLVLLEENAHFIYEVYKDLSCLESDEFAKILASLERKGIRIDYFQQEFHDKLSSNIKILLTFAILKKENMVLPSTNDIEVSSKIANGETVADMLNEMISNMSEENADLFIKAMDKDFVFDVETIEKLSNEDLLEEYHNNYMNKEIHSKVLNFDGPTKNQLVKTIKKLSR